LRFHAARNCLTWSPWDWDRPNKEKDAQPQFLASVD